MPEEEVKKEEEVKPENPPKQEKKPRKKRDKKKKKKKKGKKQTPDPSIPVDQLFPDGKFPIAQEFEYKLDTYRPDEKAKERELANEQEYQNHRKAAEVHRSVRKWLRENAKPGKSYYELAEGLEKRTQLLINDDKAFNGGIAFPTGCSYNNIAAHWTPNGNDKDKSVVITKDHVTSFDFGVHVNQQIIDCAFTMCWDDKYKPLLAAVKEATNTGIKAAGIDVRVGDIGAAIQEVMESHEVELDGKMYQVQSIRNLTGHSIAPGIIHAGKSVPIVKGGPQTKMEEGEVFAIETFGSIRGKGVVREFGDCSHYMKNMQGPQSLMSIRNPRARALMKFINENFGSMAFCLRYLDRLGQTNYHMALRYLVNEGFITKYPPLADMQGSYTAQYEHTLVLKPTKKEILSRGSDY